MKQPNNIRKRINSVSAISKNIISIFKKLNYMEINDSTNSELFQKYKSKLNELLEHEKGVCEKLSKEESFDKTILLILENPQYFQKQFNLQGLTFSRVFRNMFIHNFNEKHNIKILNVIPTLSNIEISDKYPVSLINAYSEDLFSVYIKLLDHKISNENSTVKESLINEKYKLFMLYANTNNLLINQEEKYLGSKMLEAIHNNKLDPRLINHLIADFSLQFCDDYYDNILTISNEKLVSDNPKKNILKLNLLDTILTFTNYETMQKMEDLFYKKHYYFSRENNIENDQICDIIIAKIKNPEQKVKTFTN